MFAVPFRLILSHCWQLHVSVHRLRPQSHVYPGQKDKPDAGIGQKAPRSASQGHQRAETTDTQRPGDLTQVTFCDSVQKETVTAVGVATLWSGWLP